jgi:hypothetical protein|nr:MAG TPA: restriction alleviation protein [Caudoviricetes sp.]
MMNRKKCWKCGSENVGVASETNKIAGFMFAEYRIMCYECGAMGEAAKNMDDAWYLWNASDAAEKKVAVQATRKTILDAAEKCVCQDRLAEYGTPEESCGRIASLWSAYKGVDFDPFDVAMMMVLLKVSRAKGNPTHTDSYVDLCGYGSIAGELANKD